MGQVAKKRVASRVTSFYITPLMDPDTIRRGQLEKEPVQQAYLNRLVREMKENGAPTVWDTSKPPPGALLYPTLNQLDQWWINFKEGGYDAISHDLETAGRYIICDGLTPLRIDTGTLGQSLCLRFRGRYGHHWWPNRSEHNKAVSWLGMVLAEPSVSFVGHNIVGFDIPILHDHGFEVAGPILDTMVLMSRAYPELQKGLGFCATLFTGAPAWKRMVRSEANMEGEGKG